MRKFIGVFSSAALLATLLLPVATASVAAASTTVVVKPSSLGGWQIIPDGTVPYGFVAGPASIGSGSLQFGPIDGSVAANKFVMFPPYAGLVSDLTSVSYDFYIDPASSGGAGDATHFYVNVYVDDASNGIGFFGPGPSSTGFYDCRYDSVPSAGVVGAWTTHSFNQTSSWTTVINRTGTCPSTLGTVTAGSTVRFIAVNGGQSLASDAGLKGGFDKVVITTLTDATTYDFEGDLGPCSTVVDPPTTIRLTANCTTDHTLLITDGWTLDGDGYTITAVDPVGGHFLGAVVKNGGASANVMNLTVTASGLVDVCDAGPDRLRGILFDGASGSITNNTVTNVNQGPSGCQEGNAIEARNTPFDTTGTDLAVTIDRNVVNGYIKNGITANGSVAAVITNNVVTGSGPVGVPLAAQNGIQVAFGATAIVRGNAVSGNDYTPKSYVACGLLLYQADGVRASANAYFGNEQNVCNVGKGGGQFNPNP
ncbi:MAG: right-handed parallel beta-helix repeat-containing protein [Chloroflexota bacterium]